MLYNPREKIDKEIESKNKEIKSKYKEIYLLREQSRIMNLKRYPYMNCHELTVWNSSRGEYIRTSIYKLTHVCPSAFRRVEPIWNLDKEVFPIPGRKDHYDVALIFKMELNSEINKRVRTIASKKKQDNSEYILLRRVLPQIATDTLLVYPKRMIPTDLIHLIVSYLS